MSFTRGSAIAAVTVLSCVLSSARAVESIAFDSSPDVFGPSGTFSLKISGPVGHVPILFGSLSAGNTSFPQVGTLGIGPIVYIETYPPLGPQGLQLDCDTICIQLPNVINFHMQVLTFTAGPSGGTIVSGKSNVEVLTYDPNFFTDCNNNGQPDLCEIDTGSTPDCNGNKIPDSCDIASGVGKDYDNNGVLDSCQECVAYDEPNTISDPGRYILEDNGGAIAPPAYGMRLDGLCGDYPKPYTFSYEVNGAQVFLDFDGVSKARLYGKMYGGVDAGNAWDPNKKGLVDIDFTISNIVISGGVMKVFNENSVQGTVTAPFLCGTVHFKGKADGTGLVWQFDGAHGNGWVQYDNGTQGCCQDFIFGGKSTKTVCPGKPEYKDESFEGSTPLPYGESKSYNSGEYVNGVWEVIDGSVDLKHRAHLNVGTPLPTEAGNQLLDLHGSEPGAVRQTIGNLTPGKTYRLTFRYAIHPDATSATARVLLGGGSVLDHKWTATNKGNVQWLTMNQDFIAQSPNEVLVFMGESSTKDYGGVHIDTIAITLQN